MADETIRLCMIGAGDHSSRNMYPVFYFLTGQAEVTANCDLDLDKARAIGRRFGIERHYADWRQMLASEKPDGVMVCIGDRAHAELSVQIMEAGYHVYVEKPHAPSLEASKRMLEVSRQTGRICMAAFKKRFGPAYRKAREIITAAEFGRPTLLQVYRGKGGRNEGGSGWLWQWGCHTTDLMTYLFGPVASVQAIKNGADWSAVSANMQFVNGAAGNLIYCSPGGNWEDTVAVGEGMNSLRIANAIDLVQYRGNSPVGAHLPAFVAGYTHSSVEMGFVGELQEFVAAIKECRQPAANIAQATHTAALHEAMMRSLESRKPEEVEQFDPAMLGTPRPAKREGK